MSANLLVELRSEELPPKALAALAQAFALRLVEGLRRAQLTDAAPEAAQVFATPRRLGVGVPGVLAQAPARSFRHKLVPAAIGLDGAGQPTAVLRKKLDALGVAFDAERLQRESDGRQDILVITGELPGATLAQGLQAALLDAIAHLPIPKVMHYQLADGHTTVEFVRPVHSIVALLGTEVVPVQALGLQAGRTSAGHRFHAPGALDFESADSYEDQLRRQGHVMASFAARRARIVELLRAAAGADRVLMPDALVDEVTALVEWPVVLESGFEAEFLAVPQNCLILTMQQNQKYFALQDSDGRLRNRFLLVTHVESPDPALIVAGNARVVRARLADARFFFEQDSQHRLEHYLGGAAQVVYHQKLGSQQARNDRLLELARRIGAALPALGAAGLAHVERAAHLAKADLGTLMVGEFPELQGEMGAIYAARQGEDPAVAGAIEDHYRPRFAGDAVPATLVGACVALADKLEALAGLFGAGERPSGDRDPYALRRNALGVLRILEEKALPIELPALVALSFDAFVPAGLPAGFERCEEELTQFLYDRLRGVWLDRGFSAREVDAVLASRPGRIDRIGSRLRAVRAFMQLPEAEHLAAANKRIANILRKNGAEQLDAPVNHDLLQDAAEQELARAYAMVAPRVEAAVAAGDDTALLQALAPLKQPVDRFFDDVMVMAEDPALRANRLALLGRLRALMNRIGDIALLAAG